MSPGPLCLAELVCVSSCVSPPLAYSCLHHTLPRPLSLTPLTLSPLPSAHSYEERPSHASAARLHHSTSAAPLPAHRPATRASPGRRSADLRVDRSAVGSGGAPASHRSERYQEVGMSKGGYSESRHSVAASRDSGWHNLAMQDERKGRSSYGVTQGEPRTRNTRLNTTRRLSAGPINRLFCSCVVCGSGPQTSTRVVWVVIPAP